MLRGISIALAGLVLAAPAATGAPHVTMGMGEQSPSMFDDARFLDTGIRNARLILPYDVVRARGWQLAAADAWLGAARREGIEPLVTFTARWGDRRRVHLPSVREYSRRVAEFHRRYPWVNELGTWNEANLASAQPTGHHPRRTAAFYRALKRRCRRCTVVATDVLLTGNWRTWRWLRAFRAAAGRGPHIFGLHNYPDVTRLVGVRTRNFLRRVRNAEIWITETGGIVRHRHFKYDESRADKVVRHVFKLVAALPRVKRLYLYNWQYDGNVRWDSGFLGQDGKERKAYFALLDGLALDRFKPLPTPIDDPVVAPAPDPTQPGPTP